ncbi:hypothetical protein [Sinomonas sp. P47F7]|uniref:hypothetical protein n=1 Tax=Sinomonas sp. P47F7 TaxID=3410987 RepID=UPI003BF496A0
MSASTPASHAGTVSSPWARRAVAGVLGGLAGGIVFGVLMVMMGMFTTIAVMVGSNSPWVGAGIHLMISIVYGLVLTLFFSRFLHSWGRGSLAGIVYGVILWVIGPLLVMPLMLGMPVFGFSVTVMLSLMGHMIYGLLLALVALRMLKTAKA